MVPLNQECAPYFRALVGKLYVLDKITEKKADTAKDQSVFESSKN